MEHKIIKAKINKKEWTIEYKMTKKVLYFNDKNGHSLGFVINDGEVGVYQNGYRIDAKKFPRLKGSYGYTMAKEQVALFIMWLKKSQLEKKV